jgi:serine/threonine protein kinase
VEDGVLMAEASQSEDKNSDHDSGLLAKLFVILFCVYPFLTTRILHMFGCETLHANDDFEEWQQFDYHIDCRHDRQYKSFEVIAGVMILVYPLGVPAGAFWIFYQNRLRLQDASTHSSVDNTGGQQNNSNTALESVSVPWWYGNRGTFHFMVRDYKPRFYYFEIIEFIRKLCLTGLLMLPIVEKGSATQIFLGVVVGFCFTTTYVHIQPYADPRANAMRLVADFALVFTLGSLLVLHSENGTSGCAEWLDENHVGWLLCIINVVILAGASQMEVVFRLLRLYRETQLVGIMYNPEDRVTDGKGHSMLYRGEYKSSIAADPKPCVLKIRKVDRAVLRIETTIMHDCSHKNIITLFKVEVHGHTHYLAMSECECSIEQAFNFEGATEEGPRVRLRSGTPIGGGTSIPEVAPATQVCEAILQGVEAMHLAGFAHGNITPGNILLSADGTPKLAGFSSTVALNSDANAIQMNTEHMGIGYRAPEIVMERMQDVVAEIADACAVDVFALGCTFFYIISGGSHLFQIDRDPQLGGYDASVEHLLTDMVARTVAMTNDWHLEMIAEEAKDCILCMLKYEPSERPQIVLVSSCPMFWSAMEKVQYLGETIGNMLPAKVHKDKVPFVADLEAIMDAKIRPYNEQSPKEGGSWARMFDATYPIGGWGSERNAQQSTERVEYLFHAYGGNARKKEEEARWKRVTAGNAQQAKSIRTVGLLKLIRNVGFAHRNQHVERGRFLSEEHVIEWCLQPFPWLTTTVYRLQQKHPELWLEGQATSITMAGPGVTPSFDSTDNPILDMSSEDVSWSSVTIEGTSVDSERQVRSLDSEIS